MLISRFKPPITTTMWESVSKVKNLVGLAALAVGAAYLLSDKLIETGAIGDSTALAMLLGFLVVFVFGVMVLAIIGKVKEGGSSKASVKISGSGNEVQQNGGQSDIRNRNADAEIEGDNNKVNQGGA